MFIYKLGMPLAMSAFFASTPLLAQDSQLSNHSKIAMSSSDKALERDFRKFKNERKKERLRKKKNK